MRYTEKTYFDFIGKKTTIIPLLSNGNYDFNNSNIVLPKRIELQNIIKIKKKIIKKFSKLKKLLCLDFHGVTDLYDTHEKIPSSLNKCIISFIGGNPNTLGSTINSIVPRIQSGEIKLGILVYTKNNIPIVGTKGWIIKIMREVLPNLEIYIIDDSIINIRCIDKVKDKNIHIYYIDKNKQSKIKLNNILLNIETDLRVNSKDT